MTVNRKNTLLVLTLYLITVLFFPVRVNSMTPSPYRVEADNRTAENLVAYVNGRLICVVHSGEKTDIYGSFVLPEDVSFELKNARGDVVSRTTIIQDEFKKNRTVTLIIDSPVPIAKTSAGKIQAIGVHNPSDDSILILINRIPLEVVGPHYGGMVKFPSSIGDEEIKDFLLEARDALGKVLFSQSYTLPEFNEMNWRLQLKLKMGTFSIDIKNLETRSLNILVNGKLIGEAAPGNNAFSGLAVSSRLSTGGVGWEQYLIEVSDLDGNILDSKDFSWGELTYINWDIIVPLSHKLRVYNNANEALNVFVKDELLGEVPPFQNKYFLNLNVVEGESLTVRIKNVKGRVVYSETISYGAGDWSIGIPSDVSNRYVYEALGLILALAGILFLVFILYRLGKSALK